ncbi:hypothetical protein BV20DRAFT_419038 [Pilatotrama ljubarskyi]|nr:hypothetical protein BV20DRAFT_419038 [Pilatotrama ljubarskyi]
MSTTIIFVRICVSTYDTYRSFCVLGRYRYNVHFACPRFSTSTIRGSSPGPLLVTVSHRRYMHMHLNLKLEARNPGPGRRAEYHRVRTPGRSAVPRSPTARSSSDGGRSHLTP